MNVLLALCFFSIFSHAPSFIHEFLNLSTISIPVLICVFITFLIINKKCNKKYKFLFVIYFVNMIYLTANAFYYNEQPKLIQYYVFYSVFYTAIFAAIYIGNEYKLNKQSVNKIVYFTLWFLFFYSFVEIYYIYNNEGVIPWLPRVSRDAYYMYSPLGFRLRYFAYESSTAAFNILILYLIHSAVCNKNKENIIALFLTSYLLLTTMSSTFLVLFIICFLLQTLFKNKIKFKYILLLFSIIIVLCVFKSTEIYSLYNLIESKIITFITGSGDSVSGNDRHSLLVVAFKMLSESPIFGHGLSSFYNNINSGFVNFHAQTVVQLGFVGLVLSFLLLCYPFYSLKKINLNIKLSVIVSIIFLFMSNSVWDFTVYLPYLFINLKNRDLE